MMAQQQISSSQKASRRPAASGVPTSSKNSPSTTIFLLLVLLLAAATTQAFLLPSLPLASTTVTRPTMSTTTTTRMMGAATNEKADAVDSDTSSSSAKGAVTLGPYKNGALVVALPKPTVTDAQVEAAAKTAGKKTFKLTPVRFVEEGGTRMGHTVMCDWKATYLSGGDPAKYSLRVGTPLPKADIKNFMLELKEDQKEPMASFARAVATGMGQMETKMFEIEMPESATIESWRGVRCKIMLLVRSINVKEELAADARSEEDKKATIRADLQAKADAAARVEAIAHFRACLLDTTQTETEKMQESVSWAKFGVNSLKDYKWNLIQEAIAAAERIDFSEVPSFLLKENPPVWT